MKQVIVTSIFVLGLAGLSFGQNNVSGVAKTQPDVGEATLGPRSSNPNSNNSSIAKSNQNVATLTAVRQERAVNTQPSLGQGTSNSNNNSSTSRSNGAVQASGVAKTEKEVGVPSIQPASITPNSPK